MNRIAFLAVVLSVSCLLADDANPQTLKNLIDQLGADPYVEREEAARKLRTIGKSALPALKEALDRDDFEIVTRARALIIQIGTTRLPGGDVLPDNPFRPTRVRAFTIDGQRVLDVVEGQRSIRLEQGPGGLTLNVTGPLDGKRVTREYVANGADQLQRRNPEAHALYLRIKDLAPQVPEPRAEIDPVMRAGLVVGPAEAPDELDLLRVQLEAQMHRGRVNRDRRDAIRAGIQQLARTREACDLEAYAARSDELRKLLDDAGMDPGDLLPPPANLRLGVSLAMDLNGQLRVSRITQNSRGAAIGLQVGDLIQRVDGEEVRTVSALRRAVSANEKRLILLVLRDGETVRLQEKQDVTGPAAAGRRQS